ncbi:MAG: tRNA lysidine(34) synthetase TilS, partial [Muribaculaceae bacterium]|nr:tRNA lysidine(34) synthetase TilS [Muribaculaceae bacterium]
IVRRTLAERLRLRADLPVVVAVSGGADSVALLSILCEEGYQCVAAHCNFHLRGEESTRDMRFVEELTEKLGVDLYIKDFNVAAAMASTGESVEMACRRLRYEWFEELLTLLRADDVAVGHHREDNVETFFLNLARGTGIAGLTGMAYRRDNIVRPLLDCSRRQIEKYLAERGLGYVNDSTNVEDHYRRNKIRNRLLPLFDELIPGATEGVERTMKMLGEARSVYDHAVAAAAARYGTPEGGEIDVEGLAHEPDAALILFEILRPAGFTMTQVNNILDDVARSGVTFASPAGTCAAELSRGRLYIHRNMEGGTDDSAEYELDLSRDVNKPVRISIDRSRSVKYFSPVASPDVLYLDGAALDGEPRWVLRKWRRGDRIKPFGMSGTRLVSDLFSDAKMTSQQKRDAWLLTRDDRVVWVLGVRTSAHYPVTKRSKSYVVLRFER